LPVETNPSRKWGAPQEKTLPKERKTRCTGSEVWTLATVLDSNAPPSGGGGVSRPGGKVRPHATGHEKGSTSRWSVRERGPSLGGRCQSGGGSTPQRILEKREKEGRRQGVGTTRSAEQKNQGSEEGSAVPPTMVGNVQSKIQPSHHRKGTARGAGFPPHKKRRGGSPPVVQVKESLVDAQRKAGQSLKKKKTAKRRGRNRF